MQGTLSYFEVISSPQGLTFVGDLPGHLEEQQVVSGQLLLLPGWKQPAEGGHGQRSGQRHLLLGGGPAEEEKAPVQCEGSFKRSQWLVTLEVKSLATEGDEQVKQTLWGSFPPSSPPSTRSQFVWCGDTQTSGSKVEWMLTQQTGGSAPHPPVAAANERQLQRVLLHLNTSRRNTTVGFM